MPRKNSKVKRRHLPKHGYKAPTRTKKGRLPLDPRPGNWAVRPIPSARTPSLNEADEVKVQKQMKKDEERYKAAAKRLSEALKKRKAIQIKKKKAKKK